jgi:hypothetical protein
VRTLKSEPAQGSQSESFVGPLRLCANVLNDVGACLFVKAQAAEKLGKTKETLAAYQQLVELSYARVYDPNGFFWSPADAATARLNGSHQ